MMPDAQNSWWHIVHQVLHEEWGFDAHVLTPDTLLFAENLDSWMDWTELLQTIADVVPLDPTRIPVNGLKCGRDLTQSLARIFGEPSRLIHQGA